MAVRGDEIPAWVRDLAARHDAEHEPGCLGSVRYIDDVARRRGAGEIVLGASVSLGRAVDVGAGARKGDERPVFDIEVHVVRQGPLWIGTDRVAIDCHGLVNTHLDALSHVGVDGTWHGGVPCEAVQDSDRSLQAWARHGLATRGILADVTAVRGEAWIENGRPVRGEEIERAVERSGVAFEPGDALLLYMGRDRFEDAGHTLLAIADAPEGRAGLGTDAAEWIADNRVSILCWDFLDAHGHGGDLLPVHTLVWAVGLALVDNCDLGDVAQQLAAKQRTAGLLVVAPPAIPRATGSLVSPLLIY